jgi:hypothetical protein
VVPFLGLPSTTYTKNIMSIKAVNLVTAWALKPYPPLIHEDKRASPESHNEYMKYAVDAVKQGTKYGDFYDWAKGEGLAKDFRFFGKLMNAFKDARYDKEGTSK